MSQEIVNKHLDGEIEVKNVSFEYENKTYNGSNFIIKLPI